MNTNDTDKLGILVAALRLSIDGCSVKASHYIVTNYMYLLQYTPGIFEIIHYYGGRFIYVVRIIRVASSGNEL